MKILITGSDGYIGKALVQHLISLGYEVAGIDNFLRRKMVKEVGGQSIIPINPEVVQGPHMFFQGDLTDYAFVITTMKKFQPDTIVYLGQIPSAPYSMIDHDHCCFTWKNNTIGCLNMIHAIKEVCPNAHLIKLGSMGEFGTPEFEIKEHRDQPRYPGSWYHSSKVADSFNVDFACRIGQLRATDIMQGVVFGCGPYKTRFDVDEYFGTFINRIVSQAIIGMPLTVYGEGEQKRGFLPLIDSINCMVLAITNEPEAGEYRMINQYDLVWSLNDLAELVKMIGNRKGYQVTIAHLSNPRIENENHLYESCHEKLDKLGYKPVGKIEEIIDEMFEVLMPHIQRIEEVKAVMKPRTNWR